MGWAGHRATDNEALILGDLGVLFIHALRTPVYVVFSALLLQFSMDETEALGRPTPTGGRIHINTQLHDMMPQGSTGIVEPEALNIQRGSI